MSEDQTAKEIAVLSAASRQDLLLRWQELEGSAAPDGLSTSLLRRGVIYAVQAKRYGCLPPAHRKTLLQVAASKTAAPPTSLKTGARLVREWNGVAHIVDIVEGGFRYRDKTHASLTAIAKEITGAHWSGPRFFGIRGQGAMSQRIVRCAIYTRKSSEEGLEQEFNSLDAQYEACSAYIVSQKSEGWKRLSGRYDDGGISGGTLERPALRRLLTDIEAGRVDLVVVYKIDRLTRSLMDFSKLVERFDKSNCSFVSVTQAFNTSTSMGRLTLNVLLSFAQFEREVTAERIRDKIAASKKKGMWMGGIPPIGYTARDKMLIVDPAGAKIVARVFATYLEVECLNRLKREVDRLGYTTRPSRPGAEATPYSRGHLYALLRNPIYVGEVRHKDQRYPGRHEAIIDRETWDRAQVMLEAKSQTVRGKGRQAPDRSPLTGRLFDETGDRLTPSYTKKKERRIRYFVSNRLVDRSATKTSDRSGWRLPADQLEEAVVSAIADRLKTAKPMSATDVGTIKRVAQSIDQISSGKARASGLLDLVSRVQVTPGILEIELQRDKLALLFESSPNDVPADVATVSAQFQQRRRGIETKLVYGHEPPKVDAVLLRRVARGYAWWEEIRTGRATFKEIVKREKLSRRFVAIHLDLAFLAPDIVVAIIDGKQASTLSAQALRDAHTPSSWSAQRTVLANC